MTNQQQMNSVPKPVAAVCDQPACACAGSRTPGGKRNITLTKEGFKSRVFFGWLLTKLCTEVFFAKQLDGSGTRRHRSLQMQAWWDWQGMPLAEDQYQYH
jgi:hypothetical protein